MTIDAIKYLALFKKYYRENAHELCFFKDTNCSENIIKAHSIQNSFVLDQLSTDGHVYTLDYTSDGSIDFKNTSRNKASVFTGFCSYHDSHLFSSIDFNNDSQIATLSSAQVVLFNLRTLTREYWSKLNAVKSMSFLKKAVETKNADDIVKIYPFLIGQTIDWNFMNTELFADAISGQACGLNDVKPIYESNLYQVREKKYHLTKHTHLVINKPAPFALCSFISPVVDFEGKPQNNFSSKTVNFLGLNIFPHKDKTHILITWHRKVNYDVFGNQLHKMSDEEKEIAISKFTLAHSENFVFSKGYIDGLSVEKKDKIKKIFITTATTPFFRLADLPDVNLFSRD